MRHVALGDYVKEGKALFKVVDLTHIWVMFDAYESDLPWIKLNDEVSFEILSLPSKEFKGNVTFIDPFLNSSTRVAKVRVELNNPDIIIKPGMFTKGLLFSKSAETEQILIPKSAILWTGKRAIVYVKVKDRESPSFLYREVLLGPESGAFRVILDGLNEGEEIATNGVFKIDASAQLQGLPSMMNPDGGVANTGHDHGEMTDHSGHTANTMIKEYEVSEDFKKQLTQFYEAYLELVESFITGEQDGIQSSLVKSTERLQEIDMALLEGEAHMEWMKHLAIIQRAIKAIHNSKDIEEQRSSFAQLNIAFYKSIKSFGLDNITTYYQYCPMADRDQGAYWFSDKEEIRNPYFGEMMLKCGETREIIK